MSSKEEQELKELAAEAMVNDYLCKPFSADQLIDKVNKLLP
jgi:DNA-binding response OmpR family regulator